MLDRQPGEELSTTLVCCSSRPEYLCEGTPLLLRTRKRKLRYGARRGHVQKTDKEGGTVSFQQQAVLTRYHLSRAQRLSSRGSQPHTHTHIHTRTQRGDNRGGSFARTGGGRWPLPRGWTSSPRGSVSRRRHSSRGRTRSWHAMGSPLRTLSPTWRTVSNVSVDVLALSRMCKLALVFHFKMLNEMYRIIAGRSSDSLLPLVR